MRAAICRGYAGGVASACGVCATLTLVSCAVLSCTSATEGCLGGDDPACLPASPCPALEFSCPSDTELVLRRVERPEDRPSGIKADAAPGDILLQNGSVSVVLAGLDAPRGLAPSGGAIVDLAPREGAAEDAIGHVFQAVGILPDDAAHYDAVELLDQRPSSVSAIFRGRLDARPDMRIATRYELRACDPGLRIRSELFNGARDALPVFLSDAAFWGDRNLTPFVPVPGRGYVHPELDLEHLDRAFGDTPFLVADAHDEASSTYGWLACDARQLSGFHNTTISAVGPERVLLEPFDGLVFERFAAARPGPGLSRAVDTVLAARRMLFGEPTTRVTGKVRAAGAIGDPFAAGERRLSLLFFDSEKQTAVSEIVPNPAGEFELSLPRGRHYRVQPFVLGRAFGAGVEFEADVDVIALNELESPTPGRLHVEVNDAEGEPIVAEVVLIPAAPTSASQVQGSVFGVFDEKRCTPYLGPPHGGSPACNRVLVDATGRTEFWVPPGNYYVYATHGPFWSLARQRVSLRASERQQLSFVLRSLPLLPVDVLSADLHVHAGASFDSNLPERDRALSFIAQGVQVIAATDHDVVTDYASTLRELGLSDRVRVMPGVETTGQILFLRPPGSEIPRVIGHFNFWPLRRDIGLPRNGAPDDERLEPGALMDRMQPLFSGVSVAQMNHPFARGELGRDHGYLSAIGYDPRRAVPPGPNDTPEGQLLRASASGRTNLAFDAQEVMNGASLENFLRYRAGWFSFLNQGILRAGTANSDSHTLAIEVLGYPRNLVLGQPELRAFDPDRFNEAVRRGALIGTNGPVLEVCLKESDGDCLPPSLEARVPSAASKLSVRVSAAPFIPVSEVRFIVNGQQVKTVALPEALPSEPFGVEGLERYRAELDLRELVASSGDAWLVVEAGLPLPLSADLEDDDGLPDTTDNDRDGRVDAKDGIGDFREPARAAPGGAEQSDMRIHVEALAPGVWPTSFSNPIIIDWSGDGFEAPGL
ncbi:MAG TPA: CehA/McbA family metallohydrolase [Polyangiaceae bacterium]|nr:CehA/McbA family metallohydrolase [Polyangiaceae bacterium]